MTVIFTASDSASGVTEMDHVCNACTRCKGFGC